MAISQQNRLLMIKKMKEITNRFLNENPDYKIPKGFRQYIEKKPKSLPNYGYKKHYA